MGINIGRVILGGLVAGLVINIVEGLQSRLFLEEWKGALAALGKTLEETRAMMEFFLLFGFIFGIFAVWF